MANGIPSVLLMLVTQYRIDWEKVHLRAKYYSSEVSSQDKYGRSVLYHACHRNAPHFVVKSILRADPNAAHVLTDEGETALEMACRRKASLKVIKSVAEAYPLATLTRNDSGETPLSALWKSYMESVTHDATNMNVAKSREKAIVTAIKSYETGRNLSDYYANAVRGLWGKVKYLLEITDRAISSVRNENTPKFDLLHAASRSHAPIAILEISSQLYPSQLSARDEMGRLPLHLALEACGNIYSCPNRFNKKISSSAICSFEGQNNKSNLHISRDQSHIKLILEVLIKGYPEAAYVPDQNGCYPLCMAIDNGVSWNEGVDLLVRSAPEFLWKCDLRTSFHPFMQAAVCKKADLNTIFELIKALPELIQMR